MRRLPNDAIMFSGREHSILVLLADGLLNKDIASQLGVSQSTIKNRISMMLRSLNTRSRTGLASFALQHRSVMGAANATIDPACRCPVCRGEHSAIA